MFFFVSDIEMRLWYLLLVLSIFVHRLLICYMTKHRLQTKVVVVEYSSGYFKDFLSSSLALKSNNNIMTLQLFFVFKHSWSNFKLLYVTNMTSILGTSLHVFWLLILVKPQNILLLQFNWVIWFHIFLLNCI